jgi:hypothetical protein
MPTTETRTDPDDIYGWTTIESTFDDNGILTAKTTNYDNGTTRQDDYFPDGYVDPLDIAIGSVGQVTLQSDLPVGAGSLYSWNSILTYYSLTSPGLRLFQQIIDDTGLEKNTTYTEDGAVARVEQLDLGDVKSWTNYTRTYDDDPRVSSTRIVYDDGDVYEKTTAVSTYGGDHEFLYDETVTREDVSNSQDYVYETTVHFVVEASQFDPTYEDYSALIGSETLFDDGVLVEFSSLNPDYGQYVQVSTDQNDVYDWATITEDFSTSQNGFVDSSHINGSIDTRYDDGSYQREIFSFSVTGGIEGTYQYDATGQMTYSEATFYDAEGQITEFSNEIYGGLTTNTLYELGVRATKIEMDYTYNVKNFEDRSTSYDENGAISSRETYFDNGQEQTELFYSSGVRQNKIIVDASDIANYALKADAYDETGALTERRTHYDDGRELVDTYVDGNRTTRVTTDAQDAFNYALRADVYDDTGALVNRYIDYDDGRFYTEYYEDGVRTAKVTEDTNDAYNYTQKADVFGSDGLQSRRIVEYDDGRSQNSNYEAGVLVNTLIEDHDDAFNYTTINVSYDAQSGEEIRETAYDDGRVRTQLKEDGVLLFVADEDMSTDGLAYNFVVKGTQYDTNGSRVQSKTVLDSGDQFVFKYDENITSQRVDYDGDGSETWAFKVTDYAPDTAPVVTYYDTIAETPSVIVDDFFTGTS